MFHDAPNDINFVFCTLMIFCKNLIKFIWFVFLKIISALFIGMEVVVLSKLQCLQFLVKVKHYKL
jgi:hypothetical protein